MMLLLIAVSLGVIWLCIVLPSFRVAVAILVGAAALLVFVMSAPERNAQETSTPPS
jgi:hypothetical protein